MFRNRIFVCGFVIVVLALVVRVATLLLQGPALPDGDATNYMRIAQNIHDGVGNVTDRGVPNILHAPLYPLLVALTLFVVHSPERATLVVSMVSGLLVVALIYRLTYLIAGLPTAVIAGCLAAFHPMLVDASIDSLSEATFMMCVFAGLCALQGLLRRASLLQSAAVGLCFGCAYIAREEGMAFLLAAILVILVLNLRRRMPAITTAAQMAIVLLAAAIPAVPYVAFLTSVTGHVALEAKSASNYQIANQILHGKTYLAAANAIGPHLEDVGVEVGPSYPFNGARLPVPTFIDQLRLAVGVAPSQLHNLYSYFFPKRNGMIVFTLFALLGAIARLRSRRDLSIDLVLLYGAGIEIAALLTLDYYWPRFGYTLGALLVPWSACGMMIAFTWLRSKFGISHRTAPRAAAVVLGLFVGLWFVSNAVDLHRSAVDPKVFQDAGLWIAEHSSGRPLLFADDPASAYYAGAVARVLPYTDSATAIRYIESRAPAFVVVTNVFDNEPYVSMWDRNRVPAGTRVFREASGNERISVYRFAVR